MHDRIDSILATTILLAAIAAFIAGCISPLQVTIRPFTIEISSPDSLSRDQVDVQNDNN